MEDKSGAASLQQLDDSGEVQTISEEPKRTDTIDWDELVVGAHVWNSLSSKWTVDKCSNKYYTQMAHSSCPRVFQVAPDQF